MQNKLEQICKALTRCLACNSADLETVLDLGKQALANEFTDMPVVNETYPLALNFCINCSHLQLTHVVSRERIFQNYQYLSGTSETLKIDFENFADQLTLKHGVSSVLDVACNDGSQLDAFKKLGWETTGVDPAENIYPISSKNHQIICDFLKIEHVEKISANISIAQNVIAHTPNPQELLRIMSQISPDVYVQTSQANMVVQNQFDTIYHEHLSFFSENSYYQMSKIVEFPLTEISKRKIHGESFLFHNRRNSGWIPEPKKLTFNEVMNFTTTSTAIRKELDNEIEKLIQMGFIMVGYGAAAKGMTVLNSIEQSLDMILDDSPLKQGKYSPTKSIPIFPISKLNELGSKFVLVLLAWNFKDEILNRVSKQINESFKVLEYFPKVKVYDHAN
jgi:2-polyprenyl-3-methyl-5-hydroxy-6-metoxy-1,4-benzoquinol methylase